MRAAVLVAALASSTSIAVAAPPGMTPPVADADNPPPSGERAAELPPAPANAKSETTATVLAVAGTIVPVLIAKESADANSGGGVLLGVAGMFLLPSAGHWYAGKFATRGMALRLAGGAVASYAVFVLVASDGETSNADGLETAFWIGAATFAVGTIYDIATAGGAARDWNTKHASVRPAVVHTSIGGGTGIGGATSF